MPCFTVSYEDALELERRRSRISTSDSEMEAPTSRQRYPPERFLLESNQETQYGAGNKPKNSTGTSSILQFQEKSVEEENTPPRTHHLTKMPPPLPKKRQHSDGISGLSSSPHPPPPKKMSAQCRHWEPSNSSPPHDNRISNQSPSSNPSLLDLRTKLESSFGRSLMSDEGQLMLQLALYRQNCRILAELTNMRNSVGHTSRQNKIVHPETRRALGIPLSSMESYQTFCRHLSDSHFETDVLEFLSGFGGASVKEVVGRCIDALLTNEMQQQFNRTGAKGRVAFSSHLEPLVKKTVAVSFRTTEKEIETSVGNYLRNSRDRLGGRLKRAKNPVGLKSSEVQLSLPTDSDESN